jgi:hypothetical protein
VVSISGSASNLAWPAESFFSIPNSHVAKTQSLAAHYDSRSRARYVDFEQNKDSMPRLVGYAVGHDGPVQQVVCDEGLTLAADASRLAVELFQMVVDGLARRCSAEGRRFVAYSISEPN